VSSWNLPGLQRWIAAFAILGRCSVSPPMTTDGLVAHDVSTRRTTAARMVTVRHRMAYLSEDAVSASYVSLWEQKMEAFLCFSAPALVPLSGYNCGDCRCVILAEDGAVGLCRDGWSKPGRSRRPDLTSPFHDTMKPHNVRRRRRVTMTKADFRTTAGM